MCIVHSKTDMFCNSACVSINTHGSYYDVQLDFFVRICVLNDTAKKLLILLCACMCENIAKDNLSSNFNGHL